MKNLTQIILLLLWIVNLNAQVELDLRNLNLESSDTIEFTKIENTSITNFFNEIEMSSVTHEPFSAKISNEKTSHVNFEKELVGSDVEVKFGLETFNMDFTAFTGTFGEDEILILSSEMFNSIKISNQQSVVEIFRDIDPDSGKEEIYYIKSRFEEEVNEACAQCEHPDKVEDDFDQRGTIENRAGCNNNDEYIVEMGLASDFTYFATNNFSGSQVISRMFSSFMIASNHYKRCNMRVFLTISGFSVETSAYQFYNYPACLLYPNSVDALAYNAEFAGSAGQPAGDFATLYTSIFLRGALCIGGIGGMAYFTDGVCDWNNTNIVESRTGTSKGNLTAHELGHNLGVGINHGNNPPNFFYEDWDPIWHSNTVNAIHSNLDTKDCVNHFEYCCINLQDIYLCEGDSVACITLPSCGGTYTKPNGDRIGNQYCVGPGYYSVDQRTSFTGCQFNRTSFRVIDCVGKGNNYGYTPLEFRNICLYEDKSICVSFPCVDSWDVLDANGFFIQTNGDQICITANPSNPFGISTIKLRPRLSCGGLGTIVNWHINVEDCGDGPKFRNSSPNQDQIKLNKDESSLASFVKDENYNNSKSVVYPNPTAGRINIKSDKTIDKVEIFDLNGKLLMMTKQSSNIMTNTINQQLIIVKISYLDATSEYQKVFIVK